MAGIRFGIEASHSFGLGGFGHRGQRLDGLKLKDLAEVSLADISTGASPLGARLPMSNSTSWMSIASRCRAACLASSMWAGFRYLATPWVLPGSDLKREKHARRNRRLPFEEEQRILSYSSPRLYRLVVAAVETGCRQGELLSLQWRDVDLAGREIRIQASNAKDDEHRHIPISARLLAVLEMAQHGPAGHRFGATAFVFGDDVGGRVTTPKKAWETAVLKAHGHTPRWTKGSNSLAPESQAAYRSVDLHFHDLRHEAGSRWLEAGVPLHHVQELLGHANISTTDTYLNAGRIHLHESMLRAEAEGKVCTKFAQTPSHNPGP